MLTNNEALAAAKRYKINKEKYNYNDTYQDINFSRNRRNYERIITRISELNLIPYEILAYSELTIDEIKDYLTELLIKILGPDFREQIVELTKIIEPKKIPEYFDSIVELSHDKPTRILIPKQLYSIEIACTAHSFIRAMLAKYENERLNGVISNYHYRDLLSVAIEYIVCFELHKIFKNDKIIQSHDIIRTTTVKKCIEEDQHAKAMELYLKQQKSPIYSLYKDYFEFEPHIAYANTICDIYGNRLLDVYRVEDKELLELIRDILQGNNSIDDLLKYYQISLADPFTIKSYEAKLQFLKENYSKK